MRWDGDTPQLQLDGQWYTREELARSIFLGGPATKPDGPSDRGDG